MHSDQHRIFFTEPNSKATDQGLPYDFSSLMHYDAGCSAIEPGKPVILPRHIPVGYLRKDYAPTYLDYLHINLLYCKGKVTHNSAYVKNKQICIGD